MVLDIPTGTYMTKTTSARVMMALSRTSVDKQLSEAEKSNR
jgi:hypothetical protein